MQLRIKCSKQTKIEHVTQCRPALKFWDIWRPPLKVGCANVSVTLPKLKKPSNCMKQVAAFNLVLAWHVTYKSNLCNKTVMQNRIIGVISVGPRSIVQVEIIEKSHAAYHVVPRKPT